MVKIAGIVKWFKSHGLLLIIIALGFGLRLINLREWFQFEFDEEVIVWKLRQFVTIGKPLLIGGGTPFGFHLGPAFYYLSAIPLFFSRLDPIGWGVAAAIFGTVTIWLMWLAGKTLYNGRIGLMAALLWATSFTAVMADRHWWPLVLDPMLSLLVILYLFHILKSVKFTKLHNKWWIILGFTLAFAWQVDLTVLPLFLAAAIVAIRNWKSQKKGVAIVVLILLASTAPLALFELRHPGANLGKLMIGSDFSGLQRLDLRALWFIPQSLSRLLFPVTHLDGNLLKFYSWCKEVADGRVNGQPWWAGVIVLGLLSFPFLFVIPAILRQAQDGEHRRTKAGIYLNRFRIPPSLAVRLQELFVHGSQSAFRRAGKSGMTRNSESDLILRIMILSGVGGIILFRLMGGNLYDFYLAVLYPVVILLAARVIGFIWEKWGKIVAILGLGTIVGLNLLIIFKAYHPQGLAVKRQAVAWVISKAGNEEFDLDSISNCSRYNGVRYLFLLDRKEPLSSFVDQDLSWLYDKKGDYIKPKYLVTFITPDDLTPEQNKKYNQLKQGAINSKIFSPGLEVIISGYD